MSWLQLVAKRDEGHLWVTQTQGGSPSAPTNTTIFNIDAPSGDTHGPFRLEIGGATFNGTFDRVMYFGYNITAGGGLDVATEPAFNWNIESDYHDGTKHTVEAYWEYHKATANRTLTDGATTSGFPTVTSATGAFLTAVDVGMSISGTGIPANTYIGIRNSATSIGLSSSNTANVPVNATATNSGVTLTITPSGPTQFRPIFMQINRANGQMQMELNSSGGFIFATTDGAQTVWGSLNQAGLSITPPTNSNAGLVLQWGGGTGYNSLQINNGSGLANSFIIQPSAPNTNVWQILLNASLEATFDTTVGLTLARGLAIDPAYRAATLSSLGAQSAVASGCSLTHSVDQAMANGGLDVVAFDTEIDDTDGYHTGGSNTQLVVPAGFGGRFVVEGSIRWQTNTTGLRQLRLRKNGTTNLRFAGIDVAGTAGATVIQSVTWTGVLGDSEYVELLIYQDISGGWDLDILADADYTPAFSILRVGS